MLLAHRGQPVGLVLLRVFGVADPDQGHFQQPDDRRQHLLARQPRLREVRLAALADERQRAGEGDHPVELGLVPRLVPGRVVAMLLPTARIAAGRLDVPVAEGGDPDIGPGGRDGQRPDPLQLVRIADRPPVEADIAEPAAGPAPPDPGPVVGAVAKTRLAGHRARIGPVRSAFVRPRDFVASLGTWGCRHERSVRPASGRDAVVPARAIAFSLHGREVQTVMLA